jgi:hypothetical protein
MSGLLASSIIKSTFDKIGRFVRMLSFRIRTLISPLLGIFNFRMLNCGGSGATSHGKSIGRHTAE